MKSKEEAFLALIDEHQNLIHKVCSIYAHSDDDHKDLFQEILLQLWKAYPSFKGQSKLTTWMYRVALYTAITSFKKKKRAEDYQLEEQAQQVIASYESTELETNDEIRHLYASIDRLNASEKAVIMLFLEEYPYKEIGEILGITENNVGVKMSRIKHKLKGMLKTY